MNSDPTLEGKRSLAAENAALSIKVSELEAAGHRGTAARRAALNLMEDAVDSRRRAESLNAELVREATVRGQAEDALREVDQRKSDFLALLGHELRNPLTAIKGGIQLLQSERSRPESRAAAVPIMARQVDHMERLLDDVLDLARIERGKLQIRPETIALRTTVAGAVVMVGKSGGGGRVQVECDLTPEQTQVRGDSVRLTQVFLNLVSNALKFSPEDTPVRVTVGEEWIASGRWLAVRVRDEGSGIPAELLSHIFEAFVQLQRTGTIPEGGLGLGLTVSRELVELHGGTIEARSDGKTGTEFIVRLPAIDRGSP